MRNNWNEEAYKAKINELYNGKIKVVGHYKNTSHPVLLETPYGIVQYKKAIEALYYEPTLTGATVKIIENHDNHLTKTVSKLVDVLK